MRDISTRSRFIKVCNYRKFNELVDDKGYLELQKFECKKAPSLEKFFREEVDNSTSIYIIYDNKAKFIIGYYTLTSACMLREYETKEKNIVVDREINVEKSISCVEIEKFAINEKYLEWLKQKGYNDKKVGYFIFREYISKTIVLLSEWLSFSFVILHSINKPKVVDAYRMMDFETFEDDEMKLISSLDGVASIKGSYVDDCKFMYQPLELIVDKVWKGGM